MFFLLLALVFGFAIAGWLFHQQSVTRIAHLDSTEVIAPECVGFPVAMTLTADRRSLFAGFVRCQHFGLERIVSDERELPRVDRVALREGIASCLYSRLFVQPSIVFYLPQVPLIRIFR